MCGAECESVVHVLLECTAYSSSRASFTERLQELLGDSYADFDLLGKVEKTSYVLGSEHWEKNFKSLLFLLKEYMGRGTRKPTAEIMRYLCACGKTQF